MLAATASGLSRPVREAPMALAPDPVATRETKPELRPATVSGWTLVQRLAFRFALVYLVLYIFPFPLSTLDSLLTDLREIVTGEAPDPGERSLISQYVT